MTGPLSSTYRDVGLFGLLGLELTHSQDGSVRGRLIIDPRHRNRAGYVHGGVFCTMIDFAACAAGLHSDPGEAARYAVTLSLTTQFTKAVADGVLQVEGRIVSASRKTYTAEAQVFDDSGVIAAHGIGTFQWRPGSEPHSQMQA
ncbi:PaaI family thioesterase [Microvirga pudoricolor]|uniref:PaaI family thioesterase n=1 Tax=Microvirga pudoricolor TaxID=2778729 RepID=UPI00194F14FC|nr:PaaI family thioesterase [Microvirga pudoricolor]MBM6593124.1 PaaI family thioesterase [Microvirga pudoricolor]